MKLVVEIMMMINLAVKLGIILQIMTGAKRRLAISGIRRARAKRSTDGRRNICTLGSRETSVRTL